MSDQVIEVRIIPWQDDACDSWGVLYRYQSGHEVLHYIGRLTVAIRIAGEARPRPRFRVINGARANDDVPAKKSA